MWLLYFFILFVCFISVLNCKLIHTKDTVTHSVPCSFLVWFDFACFAFEFFFVIFFFSFGKCLCYTRTEFTQRVHTHKIRRYLFFSSFLVVKPIQNRNNVQMIFSIHHKMSIKHSSYFKQSFTIFHHNCFSNRIYFSHARYYDHNCVF